MFYVELGSEMKQFMIRTLLSPRENGIVFDNCAAMNFYPPMSTQIVHSYCIPTLFNSFPMTYQSHWCPSRLMGTLVSWFQTVVPWTESRRRRLNRCHMSMSHFRGVMDLHFRCGTLSHPHCRVLVSSVCVFIYMLMQCFVQSCYMTAIN